MTGIHSPSYVTFGPNVRGCDSSGSKIAHSLIENEAAATVTHANLRATDFDPGVLFDKTNRYNIATRVASTLAAVERLVIGGGAKALPDVSQIVKSFLWTFESGPLRVPKERDRYLRSLQATYKVIASCVDERMSEQAFVKYHLAVLMCAAFKDKTLPPVPPIAVGKGALFTGYLKETTRKWLLRKNMIGRIYSLSQSKRDWPAVNQMVIDEALVDHAKILGTAPKPISFSLIESIELEGAKLFGPDKLPLPSKFMPTGSACSQASRNEGGTCVVLKPLRIPAEALLDSKVGNLRVAEMYFEDWRRRELDRLCVTVRGKFGDIQTLGVRVVPISEPSKVRSVSVMDGNLATSVQPAQGQLVSAWKKSPRSTMTIDVDSYVRRMYFARCQHEREVADLIKLDDFPAIRKHLAYLYSGGHNYHYVEDRFVFSDELYFMSVDYKKATDYLKSEATTATLRHVTNLYARDIVDWSLMPSIMTYPASKTPSIPSVPPTAQMCGQLMGHPLSFPLLCAINSACYNHAIVVWSEREKRRLVGTPEFLLGSTDERVEFRRYIHIMMYLKCKFLRKWCLINGDDLLACVPQSFKSVFYEVTADAGLVVSIGKNYFSRDVALINSQLYRVSGSDMVRVGYLNLKLVTGASVKTGESAATPVQVARDVNKMFELAPWTVGVLPAAMGRFKHLRFGRYQPNWFLPVHLGGYGIRLQYMDQDELFVTREQRKLAALFVNSPDLQIVSAAKKVIPPRTLKAIKHKLNYHLVRRIIGPREEAISSFDSDDWTIRLTQMERASMMGADSMQWTGGPTTGMRALHLWKRTNLKRLSPMSTDGLRSWWQADFVSSAGRVPCPPLNPFHAPTIKFGIDPPTFLLRQLERKQHLEYQKVYEKYLRESIALEEELSQNPLVQALSRVQDVEYRTEFDLHKGLLKVLMEGLYVEPKKSKARRGL